jgi:hypothetical protein
LNQEPHCFEALFSSIQHSNLQVVETSLKALRNMLYCGEFNRKPIFQEGWLKELVKRISLKQYTPKIVEFATISIARCCEEQDLPNMQYQQAIAEIGTIDQLIDLLDSNLPRVSKEMVFCRFLSVMFIF